MDRFNRLLHAAQNMGAAGGGNSSGDQQNLVDNSETVYISSLALLKMLRHGRAGVPMEVMGLMLGEFVDDFTVRVVDVFAMPQSGTTVSVESVDSVFQTKMMDMLRQTGRPETVVGWYHSHPGFGCWLSSVDVNTQQSFEQLTPRAVAVVVDPIQSVKGKVVIDAFRLISPHMLVMGQEPRQTTSNLGHLNKPSIQALIHGLNRHYYSIGIQYRKTGLEENMLMNLHKEVWTEGLELPGSFGAERKKTEEGLKRLVDLADGYEKRVREENELTKEQLKTRYVGKVDPKKHIEDVGQQLIEDNIVAVSRQMIDKEASVAKKQEHTNGHSYTNGSNEMEEDLLSPMVRPSWKLNLKNAFPVPEDRDPRRHRDPTNYDGDFVRQGTFPFFSLPPELRNRIYYLVWFGSPAAGHPDSFPPLAASDRGRLNLSLVCKRLHLESTHLLYSSTSFRLFPLQDFLYLPTPLTLPPHYRTHITTLSLIVGSSWTDPPSSWRVGKAMTRCLSRMKLVHILKIFIEVDPSVPMFAGFRRSETFYTDWCGCLVRDVLKVLTLSCEVVEVDGNPGLDPHGQLSTRIVSEVEASGRKVRWGLEWADKVKRIEQRRAKGLIVSTTMDELADRLNEMEILSSTAKAASYTDSATPKSEPEPSEPQAPLPDLTKGIPSTFAAELEQAQSHAKARKSSLDITEDNADAVPGADGEGPRDRLPRSEYVSSSDRKKQIGAKGFYAFLALAVLGYTAYLGRNWESEELEKKHADAAPSGWGFGLFWNRVKTRWQSSVSYYSDPVTTKLLPDEEKDPAMRMPFTLVLSLDDLMIHSEWTRATGWRIAKRPGLDYFLRYLSQYYELVLFTTQPYASGEQVMRKLDPYMMIRWPLYREATLYQDGGCVKDLSYLNRDLKKVLIIDTDPHHVKNQPENAIILPPWKGDPKDQTLIQLIPFLEYLATMGFDDVRKVLKSFEGKSIPEEFARREKLLREKFLAEHPQKAKSKRSFGLGSIFKQQSPDGLPSLEQAQAEGKMVWDIIRERGQRNYLELEKRIQEEGAKFLAEREAEEKRMNEEAMKDFQKDCLGDELEGEEADEAYQDIIMPDVRNVDTAASDPGELGLAQPLDAMPANPGTSPNISQAPSVPASILWAVDANGFASASLLNREWYKQSQSVELYAYHLSRCPSYALSNAVLTGPFRRKDELQRIKTKFAAEVRRNLFEAYMRPRQTLINLISINASSSAAFPGGEVFRFAFSPNGQIVLALSSSRIYVLDATKDQIHVQRELKTSRRPLSASITDDGSLLAVLSSQHQANIYALTSQGIKHLQVLTMENAPRTIALAHEGTVLAAAYEGGVEVFSLTVNALSTDRRAVRSEAMDTLQFSGDGSMLVGSSQSLDEPNAVVITAPFYTENDPDVSPRELHSRMWTTQILFPQISSICSHAELLPGHTEGDANWLFAYDHSLMNFRAVRTDDTRTGVAYFLNPPTSDRFSLPCPNLAPTASACGTLVVAGFAESGLQIYGIPERLDVSPDMVSGTSEEIDEDMDSIAAKVDWRQSLFVKCRGLYSLEGYSAAKWVETSQRRRCEFAGKRLVVVAPGGVNTFGEELGDEAMPVDGSRLCLLDFDYGPSTVGEHREVTIEVGEKEPELLPEYTGDIATEVALERRRTVRGLQGRGGARLNLIRSTTATGPPVPSDYFTQAHYRPSTSQPCTPSEQPTYPGSPLSLTPSTSQLSLHRSATMGGYRAARFPPRPPLGSQQYDHATRSPPRSGSRASWETPPPPYSGGASLVNPTTSAAATQQPTVPETPPVVMSATISGNNGTFDRATTAHLQSIQFSRTRGGTGGIQLEPVTEGLSGSRVLSEPYTQSPVAHTAGLSSPFGSRAESGLGSPLSTDQSLGLRSTITQPFSPPLDQEVAPLEHRQLPNSITLTGTNLQNRLNHPVPPTPTELRLADPRLADPAAVNHTVPIRGQSSPFSPVVPVQGQTPTLDQDSQPSPPPPARGSPLINNVSNNSPNSLVLRSKSNQSQRSVLGSSSTPNLHTHEIHRPGPQIGNLTNSNSLAWTGEDQMALNQGRRNFTDPPPDSIVDPAPS
ncbi:hypothetical protein DV738_g4951, partial [Chaetothyriales sp. CBS 135597]